MNHSVQSLVLNVTRRLLLILLFTYPAGFRGSCGTAMIDLYRERFAERVRVGGVKAGLALFFRTAANFVWTGIVERLVGILKRRATHGNAPLMRLYSPVRTTGLPAVVGDLLRGVRFAFKEIRHAPVLMAAALLSLTLGIGATTAVFGLVHAVLLSPLPFHDEDNLVRIYQIPHDRPTRISLIPLTYVEIERQQTVFSNMVAHRYSDATLLRDDGTAERVVAISVSRDWLETLGVEPLLGRGFSPDEALAGSSSTVAVISHRLSQREYGGDTAVVGRSITINQETKTIVGVMPPRYNYPYYADVWLPMQVDPVGRGTWGLNVQARIAPGVTLAQAIAELDVIGSRLAAEHPDRHRGATLMPIRLRETLVQDDDRLILALFGAVVFVLLIVCANLANLLLARGIDRGKQFAIRAALGANRARLLRENLAENLTVSLLGGAAGFVVAAWTTQFLVTLVPDALGFVVPDVSVERMSFLFCLAVATTCALFFGSLPAWRASDADPASTMHCSSRSVTRRRSTSSNALVVGEVSLAFILLAAAGLMVQNFIAVQALDPGYEAENLWLVTTALDRPDYAAAARRINYVAEVEAAVNELPGVMQAGVTSMFPWNRSNTLARIEVEGRGFDPDERILVNHRSVTPGFLESVGIPLLEGRYLDDRDREDGIPAVVVSKSTAQFLWPNENPIGRRLRDASSEADSGTWQTVVGVVADVREYDQQPMTWYVPYAQEADANTAANLVVVARARGEMKIEHLRRAVTSVDPSLPVNEILPASLLQAESIAGMRFTTLLFGVFSVVGLLMAAIGIYGVLAYSVSRRIREIGIQLALGARPAVILRAVLLHGLTLVVAGLGAGVIGALLATRAAGSVIPELGDPNAGAMFAATVILGLVAAIATFVPARRAMRAEPIEVLRAD